MVAAVVVTFNLGHAMLESTILAILLAIWPARSKDEMVQPQQLASVIAEVAGPKNRDLAIALIVQAEAESHFSARIQAGNCKPRECDGGKAHGLWQPHDDRGGQLWENAVGLERENLVAGAQLAAIRLRSCTRSLVERYSAQSGRGCVELTFGVKRAARHRELMALSYRVAKEEPK